MQFVFFLLRVTPAAVDVRIVADGEDLVYAEMLRQQADGLQLQAFGEQPVAGFGRKLDLIVLDPGFGAL